MKNFKLLLLLPVVFAGAAHAVLPPSPAELAAAMEKCESMIQTKDDVDTFTPSSHYHPKFVIGDENEAKTGHEFTLKYNNISKFYCEGVLGYKGEITLNEQVYKNGKPQ